MQEKAYELCGIKPDEFWRTTPADLHLMLSTAASKKERVEELEYGRAYRQAFLCTAYAEKGTTVYDFLKEYPIPTTPQERKVMTDPDIEATVVNFVYPTLKAAGGGDL